ncbi:MAG TPA: XdhC/CoxI family protein [Thermoanaerobaculia bacterium]|nr:XdhC/CoxI family protein [Thermoanaerobaculia bacterium]
MSTPSVADVLAAAGAAVRQGGRAVLCSIVRAEGSTPGKPGWRLLVRPDETVLGNLGGGAFEAMVAVDATAKLADPEAGSEVKRYYLTETASKGQATGMVCGGMMEVFLEVLEANPLLVVYGGGPVGQALARAAELAGFDRLVVDDREAFRDPALFPGGTRFADLPTEKPSADDPGAHLEPYSDREVYAAVVSRCWETDCAAVAALLAHRPPHLRYLGLMGSRRKIDRVVEEVEGRGLSLDGVPLRAPIGLPIGGDSPGEIAIAILAEILETRYRRTT